MLRVMLLTKERRTDRVLVSPISREMAALNRKSSVKWLVTWETQKKNAKITNKLTDRVRPRWAGKLVKLPRWVGCVGCLAAAVITNHLVEQQTVNNIQLFLAFWEGEAN